MSTVYTQSPIRLALSLVSSPPVAPVDANTNARPAFWRGQPVVLQGAIFAPDGSCVDLSNATAIQITVQDSPTAANVILNKSITVGILPTIKVADWLAGVAQQFSIALSAAETDWDLGAATSADFWISLRVWTASGAIVYGAGYFTVFNPGIALPVIPPSLVSLHVQANATGNSTITPTSLVHTEQITVSGAAGTRNFIVAVAGLVAGAQVDIATVFAGGAANGITINVYAVSLSGALLFTFARNAGETNVLFKLTADGAGGFVDVTEVVFPPTAIPSPVDNSIVDLAGLAAVATVFLTVPFIKIWVDSSDGTTQTWVLRAGTDATSSGVQQPNDFNLSTNAKVWYRAS